MNIRTVRQMNGRKMDSQMYSWTVRCTVGQSDVQLDSQMYSWTVRCIVEQTDVKTDREKYIWMDR